MTNTGYRLRQIDDSTRHEHSLLTEHDICVYLRERTSGQNYSFSDTNQLITNLKKPVNRSQAELKYKAGAISQCARELREAIREDWFRVTTLVPIPPSKSQTHALYDDRMEKVCNQIYPDLDVRSLVRQGVDMEPSHTRQPGERTTVGELTASYTIDESIAEPAPTQIAIVDDMLTAGTHYRAMHQVLSERFPGVPLFGLFIARRIFPDE